MSNQGNIKPLSLKCRICGGDLVNDYITASCACEHCGNRWAISDMIPKVKEYSHITEKLRKAVELLSDSKDRVDISRARSMLKSAEEDCLKESSDITSELLEICNGAQAQAEARLSYLAGKEYFEKKNYDRARSEFEKIRDYRDSVSYIEKCDEEILVARKRRIPFAVIFGMILPALLAVALHLGFNLHIALCIPIFLAGSALFAFGIYRGGALSVIVYILSIAFIIPVVIFIILTAAFHLGRTLSIILAIGIPVAVTVLLLVMSENKK